MALIRPGFSAITLDDRGGGVATAARLMWQAMQQEWEGQGRLLVLEDGESVGHARWSQAVERVGFGLRVFAAQAFGGCDWMLYSHLSLARVQSLMPSPLRRPYAIFLHGIEAWRALSPRRRSTIEQASLLLCNSSYTAARVRAVHPWIGPIVPCPLALPKDPTGDLAETTRDPARRAVARNVITVARMSSAERYKGHDQLLEAWPEVLRNAADARLTFVGGGDDVARLKEKARALGIAQQVEFPGFVSRSTLANRYADARVFAMPSREEGFGLVYLEAMRHRLPCIGSIHDAASDVIVDGDTGFLVDQADVPGIARRLSTLLSDDAVCRRMGESGYQRERSEFSFDAFSVRFRLALRAAFDHASEPDPVIG